MTDRRFWGICILIAAAFTGATLFSASRFTDKFTSPDETANAVLARHIAQGGGLTIPDSVAQRFPVVHPRSFIVTGAGLALESFLGMPALYGAIGRVVGVSALPSLTPIATGLALLCYATALKRLFGSPVALTAAALLALHPALFSYTIRGFYHNALFLDFLLFAFAAFVAGLSGTTRRSLLLLAAGVATGAAIAVRPSEAAWILGVLLLLAVALWRRQRTFRHFFWAFLLGLALPTGLILVLNAQVFGHPLATAYTLESTPTLLTVESAQSVIERFSLLVFPFGVHPKEILQNLWHYGFMLVWLPALLTTLGVLSISRRFAYQEGSVKLFLVLFGFLALWLIITYGSWDIHDNPDLGSLDTVTIGTSYVRYWLPVYAFGMPFAAVFLLALLRAAKRRLLVAALSAFLFVTFAVQTAFLDPIDGLRVAWGWSRVYAKTADAAVRITSENAIILAGRGDKIFFPGRRVIVRVSSAERKALQNILDVFPVYVYVSPVEAPEAVAATWTTDGFRVTDRMRLSESEWLLNLERAAPL